MRVQASRRREIAPTLAGKRILVTGASGDIGLAVCRRLESQGVHVVASDLPENLTEGPYESAAFDVTQEAAVLSGIREAAPLDGLLLCHGVTSRGRIVDTPASATRKVIEVNLIGAANCVTAALPGLIERRGRIGVISSVAGFGPLVDRSAYSASKHGIFGYFDTLRAELSGTGVSVTVVAPSFVLTGIEDRAVFQSGDWTTTGEVMTPDRVAAAIVEAFAARRRFALPSRTAKAAWVVSRLMPRLYEQLMLRQVEVKDT